MMSSVFRLIGYSQPIHNFLRAPWNSAEVYNINLLLRKISIDTFGALMVTLMVTFYLLMVPFLVICALLMVTFPWYGNYELILGFVILEFGIWALLQHSGYATAGACIRKHQDSILEQEAVPRHRDAITDIIHREVAR